MRILQPLQSHALPEEAHLLPQQFQSSLYFFFASLKPRNGPSKYRRQCTMEMVTPNPILKRKLGNPPYEPTSHNGIELPQAQTPTLDWPSQRSGPAHPTDPIWRYHTIKQPQHVQQQPQAVDQRRLLPEQSSSDSQEQRRRHTYAINHSPPIVQSQSQDLIVDERQSFAVIQAYLHTSVCWPQPRGPSCLLTHWVQQGCQYYFHQVTMAMKMFQALR